MSSRNRSRRRLERGAANVQDTFAVANASSVTSASSVGYWAINSTAGVANTKGSYGQLVASTAADIDVLTVVCTTPGTNLTDTSTLLDIAIGAAGLESVVVANIPIGYNSLNYGVDIPIRIPAGSRIAVRTQSAAAARVSFLSIVGLSRSVRSPVLLDTLGTDLTKSTGVIVAYPGTLHTKGGWSQVTATTSQRYAGLYLGIQGGQDTDLATTFGLVDIGIGAPGSEVALVSDIPVAFGSSETAYMFPAPSFYKADVPAGSRLSVRWQSASANNTIDATLIGVPSPLA